MFGGVVIVVVYVIVAPFHFLPFSDRQSPSSGNVSMEIAVAVVEFWFWSQEGEDHRVRGGQSGQSGEVHAAAL